MQTVPLLKVYDSKQPPFWTSVPENRGIQNPFENNTYSSNHTVFRRWKPNCVHDIYC